MSAGLTGSCCSRCQRRRAGRTSWTSTPAPGPTLPALCCGRSWLPRPWASVAQISRCAAPKCAACCRRSTCVVCTGKGPWSQVRSEVKLGQRSSRWEACMLHACAACAAHHPPSRAAAALYDLSHLANSPDPRQKQAPGSMPASSSCLLHILKPPCEPHDPRVTALCRAGAVHRSCAGSPAQEVPPDLR